MVFYLAGAVIFTYGHGFQAGENVTLMAAVCLSAGALGTSIAARAMRKMYPRNYIASNLSGWSSGSIENVFLRCGFLISVLVCVLFSALVLASSGTAALISAMSIFGGSETLLSLRKAITNGTEGYFAPGFVKQFRDILFPIFLIAFMVKASRRKPQLFQKVYLWLGTLIVIVAMLITGVRSNLVLFFACILTAQLMLKKIRKPDFGSARLPRKRGRSPLVLLIFALFSYGTLSVLLGRISTETSIWRVAYSVIENLIDRIIVTVPRENIQVYFFWKEIGVTNGAYWLEMLVGILPGVGSQTLANMLHSINGGSSQGNSSLGFPVEVWINFGWVGMFFWPPLFGFMLVVFDALLTKIKSPISVGIKITLGVALLKVYSPFGFMLYGGGTSVILYFCLKSIRGRTA
jgi:hypothetical protein